MTQMKDFLREDTPSLDALGQELAAALDFAIYAPRES